MPLRRRLTITATLGTVVVMIVVSGLYLVSLRRGLTGTLDAALAARAADVVAQLNATPTTAVATETNNGIVVQILSRTGTIIDSADALGTQHLIDRTVAATVSSTPSTVDTSVTLAATPATTDGGSDVFRVAAVQGPDNTIVAAAASRDSIDNAVQRSAAQLCALSVLLVGAAAAGAWLVARAALRPVDAMRRQASELGPHDPSMSISVPAGRDELARLAVTFNELLRRLGQAVEREQAFVADAGHELRTPLTVLQGELELAQRPGRTIEQLRGTVAVAAEETERLVRLAEDLLVLTRTGALDRRRSDVDVLALVHATAETARGWSTGRTVSVLGVTSGPTMTRGDASSLRRALDNLVANAVRHTPVGTAVDITVSGLSADVVVTVRDHGPGFPEDFIPKAFGRFTQADPSRSPSAPGQPSHGSGLGLAIVDVIARNHHGTVAAGNHPAGGAVVTLTLPRVDTDDGDTRS